ncbi:hypothetical protein D7D52_26555 [Nocardia yunnanensis]|uniref:Uncharacterized protein n=1 Tax=Nocardia yunnanensis TaxID=2382165 RepID=A0A386ZI34_9NOCA|nr:hypothetical protein [Nocardia yunnanensis]AYF76784.1 hypothetical protein D7D52_26555 [Nocardia yunnanensis]
MTPSPHPLQAELAEPQDVLNLLTPAESEQLLTLLRRAKLTQQRNLDAAIDSGLEALPRLVRIPARKILFGR